MAEWAATFRAKFSEDENLKATFLDDMQLLADFGDVIEVTHEYDPYEGPYIVIPKAWQDQILATKDKDMTDDVTVTEVPYTEVSNLYGTTVSIATE